MKNKILIVLFISFFPLFTFATDYNYLPADVLIKQNEEKSALDYRIKTLESQISGSDYFSKISNIDSRISELENEKNTEKNYISGIYGQYGIGNQLSSKLQDIDNKYQTQINSLQQQKSYYQKKEDDSNKAQSEIAELKKQLLDLQNQINNTSDTKIEKTATYTDKDIQDFFNYLDTLPAQDASNKYHLLLKMNPTVAYKVADLMNKKYPNGKIGTAKYDDYVKSLATTSVTNNKTVEVIPKKVETKINTDNKVKDTKQEDFYTFLDKLNKNNPSAEMNTTETPKPSFIQKVKSFFKKIFSFK